MNKIPLIMKKIIIILRVFKNFWKKRKKFKENKVKISNHLKKKN